jgi:hypothetical protein
VKVEPADLCAAPEGAARQVEAAIVCKILNGFLELGRAESEWVG